MAGPQGMSKEVVYIVIAVVCGMFGLWQVNAYVDERLAEYRSQLTDTIEVVMLKQSATVGVKLDNSMIEPAQVPQAFKIDKRAVRWSDRSKVMDKPVNSSVDKGEILMWYAMDMGGAASIKDKIPPGKKAVTVPTSILTGSAGMLRPNMSVDLYGVTKITHVGDAKDKVPDYKLVFLVKENVTIVACDYHTSSEKMDASEGGMSYSNLTILVDTNEVERFLQYVVPAKGGEDEGVTLVSVLRSDMDVKSGHVSMPLGSFEVADEIVKLHQKALKAKADGLKPETK